MTVAVNGIAHIQLTVNDPAKSLTADLSGAQFVRMVVTDGGNGNNSDHADWAGAQLHCS